LGFSTISTLFTILKLSLFSSVTITLQLIFSAIFSIPLALDWITQTWGLRKSNNKIRLFTGFILGFGVSFLSFSKVSFQTKIVLGISLSASIIMLGLIGKIIRREKDSIKIKEEKKIQNNS
jgi:uncharacterized membrane protein